jgi:hypothetical protein
MPGWNDEVAGSATELPRPLATQNGPQTVTHGTPEQEADGAGQGHQQPLDESQPRNGERREAPTREEGGEEERQGVSDGAPIAPGEPGHQAIGDDAPDGDVRRHQRSTHPAAVRAGSHDERDAGSATDGAVASYYTYFHAERFGRRARGAVLPISARRSAASRARSARNPRWTSSVFVTPG